MSKGYLIIDGNNIGHAANATRTLTANGMETQAIYGTLRAVRLAAGNYPQLTPIVLWDGASHWRKTHYPDYKANRDKEATSKHEVEQARLRETYKQQRPYITRALKFLGVRQCFCQNLEADDLVATLIKRYQPAGAKILMISGDKDWLQLVQPGVGWFDPVRDLRITNDTFTQKVGYEKEIKDRATGDVKTEWRGVPNGRAWLEVKALQGDTSDNIAGVGGIGEKGAIDLVRAFGSVAEFFTRVELEKLAVPKKLADFAGSEEKKKAFYRNMLLMDLAHPDIPKPVGLTVINEGMNKEKFTELCQDFAFASLVRDLDGWVAPFIANQH